MQPSTRKHDGQWLPFRSCRLMADVRRLKMRPAMKRVSFSLRSQLAFVAAIAVLLAFWTHFGEFLLTTAFFASLAVLATSFLPGRQIRLRRWRAGSVAVAFLIVALLASLGPASWAYTAYDPGYWKSPVLKRAFGAVYHPVGRCYSFPVEPWHGYCLSYARWWMPSQSEIQDYGWGLGLRSNGGLFVVGSPGPVS
jgi:hypothetical protein